MHTSVRLFLYFIPLEYKCCDSFDPFLQRALASCKINLCRHIETKKGRSSLSPCTGVSPFAHDPNQVRSKGENASPQVSRVRLARISQALVLQRHPLSILLASPPGRALYQYYFSRTSWPCLHCFNKVIIFTMSFLSLTSSAGFL